MDPVARGLLGCAARMVVTMATLAVSMLLTTCALWARILAPQVLREWQEQQTHNELNELKRKTRACHENHWTRRYHLL